MSTARIQPYRIVILAVQSRTSGDDNIYSSLKQDMMMTSYDLSTQDLRATFATILVPSTTKSPLRALSRDLRDS